MSICNSTEKAIKILGGCQNRGSINIYIENVFPISTSYFSSVMLTCKIELLSLNGPEYAYMCMHRFVYMGAKAVTGYF